MILLHYTMNNSIKDLFKKKGLFAPILVSVSQGWPRGGYQIFKVLDLDP